MHTKAVYQAGVSFHMAIFAIVRLPAENEGFPTLNWFEQLDLRSSTAPASLRGPLGRSLRDLPSISSS
jgi:hypothetical protein